MYGAGATDPAGSIPGPSRQRTTGAILLLRLSLGFVWALNLIYIVDPANGFFSTFSATAQSYSATTLGGPNLASWVATYSTPFALGIAAVTAFLAVAFLSGRFVRSACVLGFVFNGVLLLTQWGQIATIPGGTDIGPQPLYLAMYATLFVSYLHGPAFGSGVWRSIAARARGVRAPVPS